MTREYLKRELIAFAWWMAALFGPMILGYLAAVVLMALDVMEFRELAPEAVRWATVRAATGIWWGLVALALFGAVIHDEWRRRA